MDADTTIVATPKTRREQSRDMRIEKWLDMKVREVERESKRLATVCLNVDVAWPELLTSLDALLDAKGFCTESFDPPGGTVAKYILVKRKPVYKEDEA